MKVFGGAVFGDVALQDAPLVRNNGGGVLDSLGFAGDNHYEGRREDGKSSGEVFKFREGYCSEYCSIARADAVRRDAITTLEIIHPWVIDFT